MSSQYIIYKRMRRNYEIITLYMGTCLQNILVCLPEGIITLITVTQERKGQINVRAVEH